MDLRSSLRLSRSKGFASIVRDRRTAGYARRFAMDYKALIGRIVDDMQLPHAQGTFTDIDSLTLVTFVNRLEEETKLTIPAEELVKENFDSFDSIVAVLQRVSK
jgi:acyl carrier protein